MTAIGVAVGLGGAFATSSLLQDLLYRVTPLDGATLVAVPLLVATVALVAALHPARRAARTDPAMALRVE